MCAMDVQWNTRKVDVHFSQLSELWDEWMVAGGGQGCITLADRGCLPWYTPLLTSCGEPCSYAGFYPAFNSCTISRQVLCLVFILFNPNTIAGFFLKIVENCWKKMHGFDTNLIHYYSGAEQFLSKLSLMNEGNFFAAWITISIMMS